MTRVAHSLMMWRAERPRDAPARGARRGSVGSGAPIASRAEPHDLAPVRSGPHSGSGTEP